MRSNRWVMDRVRWAFLALALAAVAVSRASAADDDDKVLQWKTMAAVQPPYLGATNPVDGVGGGNAPWAITKKGWGHLTKDGGLEIHVRGLILPGPPFNGVNVVPFFRALVVCRSVDSAGNAVRIETYSGPFPASEEGDSDIETTLALPTPCVAPTVFVMHPDFPRWFATLGYN